MINNLISSFSSNAPLWLLMSTGVVVGVSAGFIGTFLILRRMALSGDALTHVALPGMGLALLLGLNAFWGAWAFLILAALGIWWIKRKTHLYLETLTGIFFTFSLALGILIIPKIDLLEALFGDIENLTVFNSYLAIFLGVTAIIILTIYRKRLMLLTISEDLAKTININASRLDLLFLILLGVIVALGVHVTGTLLMGALVIIPAASAQNIARSFSGYCFWSIVFGALSIIFALPIAHFFKLAPGPIVVLSAALFFIISLMPYRFRR
ncbi:MAG: ABC-3 protein [Parcubacteria group bacterium GW2011_GWA2_39_18]|nr:MAG: ABC-3 protein [Parcubacteria group bacterium GW2011_GWA2_39_18]